ncbi:Protein FAM75D1 [Tupaia chinensis]|uniref:Heat shock factor-binding protein 1 n=1 Tax=Tupaia chinensis TaxID=246437 RepID=L9KFW7_TUPCH|nr:Protein FAM75D1 [Tupaia chinensis]
MMERNLSKVENTQTTESSLQGMSDLQDPKSSDFKNHLLAELKFNLEIREQSQAHACSVDMSFAVDSLPDKAALNPAQDVSSRDVAPSPMLPVPLDDTRVFLDQPQETRAPNRDFLNTRIKKPKRDGRRVSPLVPKGELGGGGAILDPSGLRRTSHLPQGKVFPETQANKSLPSPTKKRQPPIESLFRKQMKHFFQWLCTNMKDKGQESSQEKGSSLSSPHSKGLVKRAVALSGTTKAQKYTAETSKFFEKKQGCRYKIQSTCPGEALSSPVKIDQTQHSAELHIREKPTQSCHSDYRAPSYKVTGTKSCSQGAASSVLSNPNETTRVREQNRQPQRIVALKDQHQLLLAPLLLLGKCIALGPACYSPPTPVLLLAVKAQHMWRETDHWRGSQCPVSDIYYLLSGSMTIKKTLMSPDFTGSCKLIDNMASNKPRLHLEHQAHILLAKLELSDLTASLAKAPLPEYPPGSQARPPLPTTLATIVAQEKSPAEPTIMQAKASLIPPRLTLLQQMQDKFQTMSDQIIGRIDDMSSHNDDLEKNIADLMTQAGVEELEESLSTFQVSYYHTTEPITRNTYVICSNTT